MSPRDDATQSIPFCCLGCGYNLTGLCSDESPEGVCPECGRAFRLEEIRYWQQAPRIPYFRIAGTTLLVPIPMTFCGWCPAAILVSQANSAIPGVMVGLVIMAAVAAAIHFKDTSIIAHRIAWNRGPEYGYSHDTPHDPIFWVLLIGFILIDVALACLYIIMIFR